MTDNEDFDHTAALRTVRGAQADVAERFTRGGWTYDLIYAGLVGLMVAGFALPLPFNLINEAVFLVLLLLLARWWKQRTGVWLSGVWPKKARWVAIGLGVAVILIAFVNVLWSWRGGGIAAGLACGLAAAALALIGARLWTKIYRRESGLSS